ncbi:hypothetical protein [uncultured Sphingomonas sp.]|uniref:hypothetical protein n=1 Tax=uncultured Sphingomonas sp. TaxID=158754 RepID=UPI003748BB6C
MEQEKTPRFAVSVDLEKGLMHIVVRGFWPTNVLPDDSAASFWNIEARAPMAAAS